MKQNIDDTQAARAPSKKKIRYAVVGLGHIAQAAILPGFAHARKNSELTALVSDDPDKLRAMSRLYQVDRVFSYEDYEGLLRGGEIDAVYIALPNNLHREYCVQAARAGVHVLCEKPLAPTPEDCRRIIKACADHNVKLMTAYRLHFEKGNLEAIEIVRSGEIGQSRIFNSVFSQQVRPGNMRVNESFCNGTLYDVGVYCINAARYMFREEPEEVFCTLASSDDPRFKSVEEMAAAVMRFPGERLAAFTASFGAAGTAEFEVIGTKGRIHLSDAYDYTKPVLMEVTVEGKTRKKSFAIGDQFGPELLYFSNCILKDKVPEPSGAEGLADVRIIQALYHSAKKGKTIKLRPVPRRHHPGMNQEIYRRPVPKPRLVKVKAPTV